MDFVPQTIAAVIKGNLRKPTFTLRKHALLASSKFFQQGLNAKLLYAVKTNPSDLVLNILHRTGIHAFDVASLNEIVHVKSMFPEAQLFFMNPVKSRHAIAEAYHSHGVRHFSLDAADELHKILEETNYAKDLSLHVRISIPNAYAELSLSEKFGVNLQSAPSLIKKVAKYAHSLGICFHVGSQCMHPDAYRIGIRMAAEIIEQAKSVVTYFNVGGGFPSIYPGMIPPALSEYFDAIHDEFCKIPGHESMQLLAEPGRALVAESMSLIVRVELRKGNALYITDGTYGSLFDAGTPKFVFPVKWIRPKEEQSSDLVPFSFYGPTCDSLDFMKGPFYLPSDISEGAYIEIGQMGAYGKTMATQFNGFSPDSRIVYISDPPLISLYGSGVSEKEKLEVLLT